MGNVEALGEVTELADFGDLGLSGLCVGKGTRRVSFWNVQVGKETNGGAYVGLELLDRVREELLVGRETRVGGDLFWWKQMQGVS